MEVIGLARLVVIVQMKLLERRQGLGYKRGSLVSPSRFTLGWAEGAQT
jgi:hypothetical protein